MKRTLLSILMAAAATSSILADGLKMKDVFARTPEAVLPLLSTNNKLDCIDFIENDMEAKVRNKADEYEELKQLTDNYLLMQTSQKAHTEMRLLSSTDSTFTVIVVHTCKGPISDSEAVIYNERWERQASLSPLTTRPSVEAFFPNIPAEQHETMANIINTLRDLPLIEGKLSCEHPKLTWTLSLDILEKADREVAQQLLQPVEVELPQ